MKRPAQVRGRMAGLAASISASGLRFPNPDREQGEKE